ncbi:PXMP2/4 family protein 3-like [Tripterygium wilfordii]|uniref:PXMP2/4 family protein 3-like n=1 Tax=Tripterygium wilfordii TaxID=458696 RepID=UPI0018F800C0|nr:PXMP2/4 family protein 3-like [Tripterygium wilfordii]
MSTALLRKTSLPRLLHGHLRNPIRETHQILGTQTPQTRAYFRFPHFLRKAREYELPPSSFASSFSYSSTASSSRVGFVGWYLGMVKARPVFTKSVTAALIYTAADLSSQTIAGSYSESYDLVRTLRMTGYGMLILGPSLHFWFNLMSKLFPNRDLLTTLKKMLMGQTLYGPVMTVVFFSVNAYMQGESGREIIARLKRDLVPTMINGVMYWPICDFITFKFVPVHLQPLVSNSFSYLWNVYMTYMAGLAKVDASS